MSYEIETGVEMPTSHRAAKYPWREIGVGESFFIEGRLKKITVPKSVDPATFTQAVMQKNGDGTPMGLRVKRVS